MTDIRLLARSAPAGLLLLLGGLACPGCSHTPQVAAAPPPRADAHPLPPIPSEYPHPKLPVLAGDTRHRAAGQ